MDTGVPTRSRRGLAMCNRSSESTLSPVWELDGFFMKVGGFFRVWWVFMGIEWDFWSWVGFHGD